MNIKQAADVVNDAISSKLNTRKDLMSKALSSFEKRRDLVESVRRGERPFFEELAPLTIEERKIVWGIAQNTINGDTNVD